MTTRKPKKPRRKLVRRVAALKRIRIAGMSGGWLNRPNEAGAITGYAIQLALGSDETAVVLPLRTAVTGEPAPEIEQLIEKLIEDYKGKLNISREGAEPVWPTSSELARALTVTDLALVPGGNFMTLLERLTKQVRQIMKLRILTGDLAWGGSSAGNVCLFDKVFTADVPLSEPTPYLRSKNRFVKAVGILPAVICAHANERNPATHVTKVEEFKRALRRLPVGTIGLSFDTQTGYVIRDGKFWSFTRDRYCQVVRYEVVKGRGSKKRLKITILKSTIKDGDLMGGWPLEHIFLPGSPITG